MALTLLAVAPAIETIKSFAVYQAALNSNHRASLLSGGSLICIAIDSSIPIFYASHKVRLVSRSAAQITFPVPGSQKWDGGPLHVKSLVCMPRIRNSRWYFGGMAE